jgi:5-methylcytosine-specific restriction endonuclease McrA
MIRRENEYRPETRSGAARVVVCRETGRHETSLTRSNDFDMVTGKRYLPSGRPGITAEDQAERPHLLIQPRPTDDDRRYKLERGRDYWLFAGKVYSTLGGSLSSEEVKALVPGLSRRGAAESRSKEPPNLRRESGFQPDIDQAGLYIPGYNRFQLTPLVTPEAATAQAEVPQPLRPLDDARDCWLFRMSVYSTERDVCTSADVKALVLEAENKTKARLARAHALMAQVEQLQRGGREPIPDDVKMFVWQRDAGKCVRCGSNRNLEFDHVIPVSMGGATTARNLQLLCEGCNRAKGGSLA